MDADDDVAVLAGAALAMAGPRTGPGLLTLTVTPSAWQQAVQWAREELGCIELDVRCGAFGYPVEAYLACAERCHRIVLRTVEEPYAL